MDIYGIIFIYELLTYYKTLIGIEFESITIEVRNAKNTKYNTIEWDDIEKYIDDKIEEYNKQYQNLLRDRIYNILKYEKSDLCENVIMKYAPFQKDKGYYNLWLGEDNTSKETAILQPLPYIEINHITKISGCKAKMKSSVDDYEYNVTSYITPSSSNSSSYAYILSRNVNEKECTLKYNQLAKNECADILDSIFRKANDMLDILSKTTRHESLDDNSLSVETFLLDINKYKLKQSKYINEWVQVYSPFNISNRKGVSKIDIISDADEIIKEVY